MNARDGCVMGESVSSASARGMSIQNLFPFFSCDFVGQRLAFALRVAESWQEMSDEARRVDSAWTSRAVRVSVLESSAPRVFDALNSELTSNRAQTATIGCSWISASRASPGGELHDHFTFVTTWQISNRSTALNSGS